MLESEHIFVRLKQTINDESYDDDGYVQVNDNGVGNQYLKLMEEPMRKRISCQRTTSATTNMHKRRHCLVSL